MPVPSRLPRFSHVRPFFRVRPSWTSLVALPAFGARGVSRQGRLRQRCSHAVRQYGARIVDVLLVAAWAVAIPVVMWVGAIAGF